MLEKAILTWWTVVPPQRGEIVCQFNPSSLTIQKTNNWEATVKPNYNASILHFAGGNNATYSLSLFFDSYANTDVAAGQTTGLDVREYTNQLLALSLRGAGNAISLMPYAQPPYVQLVWGKILLFTAVVESVRVQYTLFSPDGYPIRARADVEFRQNDFLLMSDDFVPAQNPTSRTDARRTRVVHRGERLDQIAFEEYGDPRYWRTLAEANELDDPLALQDGQILVIPTLD